MTRVFWIVLLAGCGAPLQHVRVVDGAGRLSVEYEKVDGVKEGPVRFFRRDGSLRTFGNYHRDRKHGEWITFDAHKDTLSDLHYVDGVKHGWQEYRADNGQLIRLERFDHGIPDGPLYMFFADGKPKEETWFDQGTAVGRHLRWWRNDTIDGCSLMGQYAYETRHGMWYGFFGNDRLSSSGAFDRGPQHGAWRRWDRDGRLILEQVFSHDTLLRTNVDRRPKH